MAGSAPGLLRAIQPGVELLGRDVSWGGVLASVESAYASRSMLSRVLLEKRRQVRRPSQSPNGGARRVSCRSRVPYLNARSK
jgi:hypothetical protein